MPRVPFRETAVVRLNASGAGTAKLGPLTAREVWYPSNVSVKTTFPGTQLVPTLESECNVFKGAAATPDNFRDTTPQGSTGDASGACSADKLVCGEYIWAVWQRGDVGVQASLTVTGVKDV